MLPPSSATAQLSEISKTSDHLQYMLNNKLYDIIILIFAIRNSVGHRLLRMSKHYH